MRVGLNPNRQKRADAFAPIVLAVLTHLPNMEGYHKDRFEVIRTCLKSMTEHAETEYTLVIWDNASCALFREWVQDEIKPDVFVQSFNIGKTGGRTSLTRLIPPQRIIAYSDDDMYFYPNWLLPQIKILQSFPNVSCVTGYPVRTAFRWGCEHTQDWARKNAKSETGRFLPNEWERDFAVSIGRDPDYHEKYTASDMDNRITYKGMQVYATSHHCQFVSYSDVIGRMLTYDNMAMGDEKQLDIALDQLGLRLATTKRLARHIGNVLHDELRNEIKTAELTAA